MAREKCATLCGNLHGTWNTTSELCHVELHVQRICFRVKKDNGEWVVDSSM